MNPKLEYIGIVQSPLKKLEDCPRQENENAPEAVITIYPEYREAMKDIKAGVELVLLTWFHKADRDALTTQPRNNPDAPLTGVFSTRSPDRPNPIGLHTVKVVEIKKDSSLKVAALEALDGTPVIDIKIVW